MRGVQLARQWRIIRLLESRRTGLTAAELAKELEVPLRTIYRDLEIIHEAGFPIHTVKIGKNSYWRIIDGFKSYPSLPLTTTELMALHMGRDILKILDGTIFRESIESLLDKVRASLPRETLQYLDNLSKRFRCGMAPAKDYRMYGKQIAELSAAIAQNKKIQIRYRALSTGEENIRTVAPYQMWVMNGTCYLIGYCQLRGGVRTFALDRIKDFRVLDESFDVPEDFSLEDYLQTAFRVMTGRPEKVVVWFRKSAAQVVKERIWHPTQEIREQEDGHLVVTLEVPINYEVISWILGFGTAARVLEPESLRNHVMQELACSLEAYGGGPLGSPKS